jgi:hypothetical protein
MNNSGMSKRGHHQRTRLYKGIKGKRPDLKAIRKKGADERAVAYSKLTTQQKIKLLDAAGFVAKRQRARLQTQLQLEAIASEQKNQTKKKVQKN